MMEQHARYMKMALSLAKRGGQAVRPNPLVGCVLVKNGKIIATGYHARYGGPHAEINALKKAGSRARGSTAYVTLEPCAHFGKTPPCTTALINAGVKVVYAAMKDPFSVVQGRGFSALRKKKIVVHVGLEESSAQKLNRPFVTWITKKRPYTILKLAQSLDGKIAARSGDSRWISSETSRNMVHELRATTDAILVGTRTARKDNPALTSHGSGKNPLRVVIDARLSLSPALQLFDTKNAPTLLVTTVASTSVRTNAFIKKGVQVLTVSQKREGIDLKALLKHLFENGIYTVLIEGGANTAERFLDQHLVDEISLFVAPKLIAGAHRMSDASLVDDVTVTKVGPDFLFRGMIKN